MLMQIEEVNTYACSSSQILSQLKQPFLYFESTYIQIRFISRSQMLTSEITRQLLHNVNLHINSNTLAVKPIPTFNIPEQISNFMQTRKALKQLQKSYPLQKLYTKINRLSSIALLYSNFRTALHEQDEPMMHRYLTNALYQQWKENKKQSFKVYSQVHNINLSQAKIVENEYGKWVQCLVYMRFQDIKWRKYVIERKLGMMAPYARGWYYIQFQN